MNHTTDPVCSPGLMSRGIWFYKRNTQQSSTCNHWPCGATGQISELFAHSQYYCTLPLRMHMFLHGPVCAERDNLSHWFCPTVELGQLCHWKGIIYMHNYDIQCHLSTRFQIVFCSSHAKLCLPHLSTGDHMLVGAITFLHQSTTQKIKSQLPTQEEK